VLPNWFVRYSSVQEQSVSLGGTNVSAGQNVSVNAATAPNGTFRFSKFAAPASGGSHLIHNGSTGSFSNLLVQDCEFWNGTNNFSGGTNSSTAVLKNNLFWRSSLYASNTLAQVSLSLSNNLLWGCSAVTLAQPSGTVWYAFNNAFDGCTISSSSRLTNGYNGYINCNKQLTPTNANNVVLTSFDYAMGSLGDFYQSSTNFVNQGSTTADLTGLYHYTTQTNQVKETNSIVDIGYHYVAVDANGNPLDKDGDGIPDYLEDANGNGLVDGGENSWTNYNSANGLTSANGLQVFTPLK
jgi:hypothetical protein